MRQIERPAAFAAKFEGVLHHRHHAQPEQIHLDDAEIFAIVLVPLRDDAAGHRRIFQRNDRAEFVLANNHAAGMLPKMARQSVDRLIQRDECRHSRVRFRQTRLFDLRCEIERVRKIAVRK